ncbi:hypothetical protein [Rhizobium leguminosarum]|uniref:hypothetical protein n=1 Tax=Rhizobium TaxID=379 RepID=UPI0013D92B40|nr:hypothetical protein [Rhizobium leguminosarum]NEK38261.1 hypothetical protein [Rhizobium leguminosarum]
MDSDPATAVRAAIKAGRLFARPRSGIVRSVRQALHKRSFPFDGSPNSSADRDTERDADRSVIEQYEPNAPPIPIPIAMVIGELD